MRIVITAAECGAFFPHPTEPCPDVSSHKASTRRERGEWTIADDGSLYTLPIGSNVVKIGRVRE